MEDIKKWALDIPQTLSSLYRDLSSMDMDLTERLSQAGFHTFHSARLWFFLIVDLVQLLGAQVARVVAWCFLLVRPWVLNGVVAFHQLDLFTQLSIGAAFVLVLLLWLMKRWIVRRRFVPRVSRWYRQKRQYIGERMLMFQAQVGEHSRVLAAMLPHLVMSGISGVLIYLVPHYLDQIVNAWPLYALGVVWPIVSCTRAIIRDDHWKMSLWLEYSIVAYFAVFISKLPFSQTAISFTPLFAEVRFFFILWLLLPITRGSHLTFRKVLWALQCLSIPGFHDLPVPPSPVPDQARARARRPRAHRAAGEGENAHGGVMGRVNNVLNTIMSYGQRVGQVGPLLVETLVLQGIVTREFANRVVALRRDNVYQLIIFCGSFLAPISLVGYLTLGILFPMRQSILMLADEEMPRVKYWLQYWSVLAMLSPMYAHFMPYFWFVPFKGTLTLLGILVLQFTDFPLEPIHEVFATIITIIEEIFRPKQRRGQKRRRENPDGQERGAADAPRDVPALPPPGMEEFSLDEPATNANASRSRRNHSTSLRRRRKKNKCDSDSASESEQKNNGSPRTSNAVIAHAEAEGEGEMDHVVRHDLNQQNGVHDGIHASPQAQPLDKVLHHQDEGRNACEYQRRHDARSPTSQLSEGGKESFANVSNPGHEMKNIGDGQSENPEELGIPSSDSECQGGTFASVSELDTEENGTVDKSIPLRRSQRIQQKIQNSADNDD